MVPKKANTKPAIRFTEAKHQRDEAEDDFLIDEDSENEDSEQMEKMQELDNERRRKEKRGRDLKSAYSKHAGISSATTRIVDLTDDQISYGIRPSTAIQLEQI